LGDLPVRQYVVTIPKMLRLCFKHDRERIDPDDHEPRRRLAGHLVHAPISLQRLR
jgi:hypothetical protein